MMGISYIEQCQHSADSGHFSAYSTPLWNEVWSVAGYDYLTRFNLYTNNGRTTSSVIPIGPSSYELFWGDKVQFIQLRKGQETLVMLDLKTFLQRLQQQTGPGSNSEVSGELMSLEG